MKRIFFYALVLFSVGTACQSSSDDFVTIRGNVSDASSGNALPGAALIIDSPSSLSGTFTSTDSVGNYVFGDIDISDATDITIRASQTGYISESTTITALPGQTISLDFDLSEEGSGSGDEDDDEVLGEPGIPAAIVLTNVSEESINIRQTGGTVSSTFSFEVQDSSGRSMNEETPVDVNFQILKGPGGGESVVPNRVTTNSNGAVVSNLFSGDSAGVVRIEAFINRTDGIRISSSPIVIAIHGGFPSPDRFFVAPVNFNLEGYSLLDASLEYSISASVGDRWGNPVKEGTAVDFRTEAGIIDGSALTNDRGFASVVLSPDGSTPGIGTSDVGFFTVTAKTVDENNDFITRDVELLFTTREATITFTSGAFDIPSNGSDNVTFTVTDLNGRPMAAGTTINVSSLSDIEVTGDSDITLGDYFTGGPGRTEFTVTVSDIDDTDASTQAATVTVTVTTPSGNETSATLTGTRAKTLRK
ncbi:MAG: hypothetical protein ED557_00835 [Balneola sp.]|nr:MAG: hypothetical protein ED557_00835 [Balneola sp.]